MANKLYQFGILLLLFGGFVTLNRSMFGGLSDTIGELGLFMLLFGMLVGLFGLAVPTHEAAKND